MSLQLDEDDLEKSLQEAAFRRGLRATKLVFLNELKSVVLRDSELRAQSKAIERAFADMASYVGSKPQSLLNLELRDFDRFGLSEHAIRRIGELAIQLESSSPKAGAAMRRLNSHGHGRSFSRQSSVADEQYEEDFEEILDEDEDDQQQQQQQQQAKAAQDRRFEAELDAITHRNGAAPALAPKVSSSVHFPSSSAAAASATASAARVAPLEAHGGVAASATTTTTSSSSVAASVVSASGARRRRKKTPEWIAQRRFTLGKQIGEGSFGQVFEAMNDAGIIVAVKRMNFLNKSAEVDDLLSEIDLMRGLSHANIVAYLGAIVDAAQCCLYIFQEWVSRGSVQALLKDLGPFPPSVVRNYTRQVLQGLEYLHGQGIVHRDIKGGNILVHNDGNVKLADFGASKKLGLERTADDGAAIKGTPYFMAPEVLSAGHYGRKGDIWAVGCTMVQMFSGEPPWKDRNLRGILQLHALLLSWDRGPPPVRSPHALPPEAHDCLALCFRKDEAARPSAAQLLLCAFLREEAALEDSTGSASCEASFYGRDHLEESGTIRRLREEISSAQVSRSQAAARGFGGFGGYGGGGGGGGFGGGFGGGHAAADDDGGASHSDLIGRVDRQLQQQQQQRGAAPPLRSIQAQAQAQLPPPSAHWQPAAPGGGGGGGVRIDTFSPRGDSRDGRDAPGTPQTTARTRLVSPSAAAANPFGRRADSRPSSQPQPQAQAQAPPDAGHVRDSLSALKRKLSASQLQPQPQPSLSSQRDGEDATPPALDRPPSRPASRPTSRRPSAEAGDVARDADRAARLLRLDDGADASARRDRVRRPRRRRRRGAEQSGVVGRRRGRGAPRAAPRGRGARATTKDAALASPASSVASTARSHSDSRPSSASPPAAAAGSRRGSLARFDTKYFDAKATDAADAKAAASDDDDGDDGRDAVDARHVAPHAHHAPLQPLPAHALHHHGAHHTRPPQRRPPQRRPPQRRYGGGGGGGGGLGGLGGPHSGSSGSLRKSASTGDSLRAVPRLAALPGATPAAAAAAAAAPSSSAASLVAKSSSARLPLDALPAAAADAARPATTAGAASAPLRGPQGPEPWRCLKCAACNTNPLFCDRCATKRGGTGARGLGAAIPRF
eukprot:gene12081-8632_t